MPSAICFNLDQSKILSSGKGFNRKKMKISLFRLAHYFNPKGQAGHRITSQLRNQSCKCKLNTLICPNHGVLEIMLNLDVYEMFENNPKL